MAAKTEYIRSPPKPDEMYGVFSPDRSHLLTGGDGPTPRPLIL